MTRTIYLLSYAAIRGARHWAVFIPNADSLTEGKDEHVTDVPGNGNLSRDITAHDALEAEAKKIDAPVASRTPLDPSAENCQTWLWTYVKSLVQKGLVDGAALDALENAKA
ncbi:hypothetical protein OPT61_g1715 [Boeremia exigua]|uniref:Uncharacterized protein n=1 Tax=Boeremia exigua TaxID=749465 RepID=A0ACC2IP95_9PLEO|nr:hypothetical protein OPT61_g1715 [Boeremia exigua]